VCLGSRFRNFAETKITIRYEDADLSLCSFQRAGDHRRLRLQRQPAPR